ncbi:MAG: DUF401 family protein [Syntrophaceae bacterium]|nr:DUF401 family protein [Syntrophaceae bacterium]
MDSISHFFQPSIVKISAVFLALLIMNRTFPLYICLLAVCVLLGLWMHMGWVCILTVMLRGSLAPSTLILALVITLIVVFSGLLKRSGRLVRIVDSMKGLSSRAGVSLALAPALIGLLPMPGGAVFSAPMVETVLGNSSIKPESKLAINYWFRHVPEFVWPLYPGFILCLSIFSLEAWRLTMIQIPMSVGAILAGLIFVLPEVSWNINASRRISKRSVLNFFRETSPILTVIVLMFALQGLAEIYRLLSGHNIPLSQHLSMTLALLMGIASVKISGNIPSRVVRSSIVESGVLSTILLVFAIMAFKGILEESQTITQIRSELQSINVSETYVIALLPLIAGLVTGIAVGFVGSSFPVVVSLIPPDQNMLPYVVLAYGAGFLGMMMSPVHLCFLVTQEYFHTNALDSYRQFWKPALFLMIWIVIFFMFYRVVL